MLTFAVQIWKGVGMNKTRIDALLGAIGGDIIGSPYEFRGVDAEHFTLFDSRCHYTDDTVLSIAVVDWLLHDGRDLQGKLIRYARRYYWAGYGTRFSKWCMDEDPQPYNSCGNGSAMRVSAVGCVAETVPEALISFFESESYEDCILKAVLTNKDTDTAAACAGAVAGAYYGLSDSMRKEILSRLPGEFVMAINKLEKTTSNKN